MKSWPRLLITFTYTLLEARPDPFGSHGAHRFTDEAIDIVLCMLINLAYSAYLFHLVGCANVALYVPTMMMILEMRT